MQRNLGTTLLLGLLSASAPAQSLTVDTIMEGEDFVGTSPSQIRWSGDSGSIIFRWRAPGDEDTGTYVIDLDGDTPRRLSDEEAETTWPVGGVWDDERRRLLFSRDGDLFIYQRDGTRRQLTDTRDAEGSPRFGPDERSVLFVRSSNLYRLNLDDGSLKQLTDFRRGRAPSEPKLSDSQKFLKQQQEKLFEEFSGEKKEDRDEARERAEERNARAFYYRDNQSIGSLRLSADGRWVSFTLNTRSGGERTLVPDFVTADGYTENRTVRQKVGDEPGTRKAGLYDVETGEVRWLHGDEGERSSIAGPFWNETGSHFAVLSISTDYEHRWIEVGSPDSPELTEVDHLHDEAWIAGPGASRLGWMPDHETLFFISEADGWAHLYLVDRDGGNRRQLTEGSWEVQGASLSADESHWLLTTNESHLGEKNVYRMDLEGGERTRLTPLEGNSAATVSPDGTKLAVLNSFITRPPELFVQDNEAGAQPRRLTHSTTEAFEQYDWYRPRIVQIEARDGAQVQARFYEPETPDENRPAVIFVHGAGYLQNAHRWWSSYYREYMFHNLLRDRGYYVLDLDYRGSAGYGRDWRTGIFRHMGGKDLTDQVDGARWLIENHGVDPERIGIYGGSYGGFITLMAMFTEPDVFAAGASLRPVTDWAHYNHGYTARILNEPQDDTEAYERSSPIYFAEGLEGALLICHGMVDTNVHFQDTVRLAQRLIELRKENWEVAIYPVEGHGFTNATSWADEYKRILKLFEENLRRR